MGNYFHVHLQKIIIFFCYYSCAVSTKSKRKIDFRKIPRSVLFFQSPQSLKERNIYFFQFFILSQVKKKERKKKMLFLNATFLRYFFSGSFSKSKSFLHTDENDYKRKVSIRRRKMLLEVIIFVQAFDPINSSEKCSSNTEAPWSSRKIAPSPVH